MLQQQIVVQRLEGKLATVTANLEPFYRKMLESLPAANAETICEHILSLLTECNIKTTTRASKIQVLVYLARSLKHKTFKEADKQDVLVYLNSLRKSETVDPKQKWVGTWNHRVIVLTRFFRWLYNPDEPDTRKRITPPCMNGIRQLKRKTKTTYEPRDMWSQIEQATFLKYCPSKRDRFYLAAAIDTSARPHELLRLNVEDLQVKIEPSTGRQYSEVLVNGKTGERTLPLIDSLPYAKDWLAEHPQSSNPSAPLFVSLGDSNKGDRLTTDGLWYCFTHYKKKVFPKLLNRNDVPKEDQQIIKAMLQKPWNVYVFRHTGLTEKAQVLKEAVMREHSGWSSTSKMPAVYVHLSGGVSSKSLLEAKGIIAKESKENRILQSKKCSHCKEPNISTAKFCLNCGYILNYDGYSLVNDGVIQKELEELKQFRAKVEHKLAEDFTLMFRDQKK